MEVRCIMYTLNANLDIISSDLVSELLIRLMRNCDSDVLNHFANV